MKKINKTLFGFMIGILVSFTIDVAAEAVISSGAVSYSNTTVSAALDELFSAVDINEKIGNMSNVSSIGDGTLAGAISTVNANTPGYPDYANSESLLITDTTELSGEEVTISKDGFILFNMRNLTLNTSMFHRIWINGFQVSQGYTLQRTHNYLTTPVFPVKKGDVVSVQCDGQGEGILYFFPPR